MNDVLLIEPPQGDVCLFCNGAGKEDTWIEVPCDVCTAFGLDKRCPRCEGSGYYGVFMDCRFCGGTGR